MLSGIIVEGDTLPYVKLYKIVIFPERKFKSKRQQRRYNRLAYNVKVVYPYAVLIGKYYQEIEHDLQYIHSESERRKYIKNKEKL